MKRILNLGNLSKEIKTIKDNKEKIVLVGGCFDIIHLGHVEFLNKSKRLGDRLLVLLESDKFIKRRKGNNRPINKQADRAKILSNLAMVDYVIKIPYFKSDKEYSRLVKKIKPDIIAITGNDPKKNNKLKESKDIGSKIIKVMERKIEYSTSKIIETLKNYQI